MLIQRLHDTISGEESRIKKRSNESNIFDKVYIALLLLSIYHSASWNIFMSLYHMPHKHYTNKYNLQQRRARKNKALWRGKEERDVHNLGPRGKQQRHYLSANKNFLKQKLRRQQQQNGPMLNADTFEKFFMCCHVRG